MWTQQRRIPTALTRRIRAYYAEIWLDFAGAPRSPASSDTSSFIIDEQSGVMYMRLLTRCIHAFYAEIWLDSAGVPGSTERDQQPYLM